MKFLLTAASALALVATAVAQGVLTINTPPSAVVCQPLLLTWTGGSPPYFLRLIFFPPNRGEQKWMTLITKSLTLRSILPGNQPGASPIHDFGQVTGNSLTWTVNVEANTSLGLTLRDSTGATAQSAPFTVQAGTDSSCVGKDPSTTAGGSSTSGGSAPGSSAPGGTTTAPPAPTTTPQTSAPPTTTPATSTKATTSSPSTSSAAATSNAAVANGVELGAAGLIAGVLAFLA